MLSVLEISVFGTLCLLRAEFNRKKIRPLPVVKAKIAGDMPWRCIRCGISSPCARS
jgi:hypothetical protein